jgi:transmembrane sensor
MTARADTSTSERRDQAGDWVVRLSAEDVGEVDWLGFKAWLDGEGDLAEAEARRAAFDWAQSLWFELDALAPAAPLAHEVRMQMRAQSRWVRPAIAAALAAAAFALWVLVPAWLHRPARPSPPSARAIYATGVGERRSVRLADGSRLDLDGGSRLSVVYTPAERRVRLEQGEVAFDVIHAPGRPFVVDAGVGQVRVLGTAFDVVRSAGRVRVAVSRGIVSFTVAGRSVRLPRGRSAAYEGGGGLQLAAVDPSVVAAWKDGRRVYRDQPLEAVAADLNRQFATPIRFGDARVARLRFTGVLTVDDERRTVGRLTALLPVRVRRVDGAVVRGSR